MSLGVPTERSGPSGQPFGYTGEVWDPETGLLNLRAQLGDILADNIVTIGVSRPAGTVAHHIVAWNAKKAATARQILQQAGIGVDDAENGVFLPHNAPKPTVGRYHDQLANNRVYYSEVERQLLQANPKNRGEEGFG